MQVNSWVLVATEVMEGFEGYKPFRELRQHGVMSYERVQDAWKAASRLNVGGRTTWNNRSFCVMHLEQFKSLVLDYYGTYGTDLCVLIQAGRA